jgi:hypothetical protein
MATDQIVAAAGPDRNDDFHRTVGKAALRPRHHGTGRRIASAVMEIRMAVT